MYNLAMNEIVDERRDPLLATRAAARHLRDDYASLQAWPLAVTGYNHGRAGVARAVKAVGSRDIMKIIRRYRGPAFRFASRNFYASYVAAYEVEQEAEKYFGKLAYEPRIAYDEVHVEDYVAFARLGFVGRSECTGVPQVEPGVRVHRRVGQALRASRKPDPDPRRAPRRLPNRLRSTPRR